MKGLHGIKRFPGLWLRISLTMPGKHPATRSDSPIDQSNDGHRLWAIARRLAFVARLEHANKLLIGLSLSVLKGQYFDIIWT